MFVVYNKLSGMYYTSNGWSEDIRLAEKLTEPRAIELVESFALHAEKGLIIGDFSHIHAP